MDNAIENLLENELLKQRCTRIVPGLTQESFILIIDKFREYVNYKRTKDDFDFLTLNREDYMKINLNKVDEKDENVLSILIDLQNELQVEITIKQAKDVFKEIIQELSVVNYII